MIRLFFIKMPYIMLYISYLTLSIDFIKIEKTVNALAFFGGLVDNLSTILVANSHEIH